ncbi:c-type cytochrome [Colwellia sp. M166]|uniref:c-type cytochrome n=1 Tax=Colwellia sp. M166 TaxID=2583805 RepID=UPI00211F1CE0|nr:c-type cytochrome [Colwellia sp. M166]UUO24376.1 c-type cytochrome [Colwellia sp. M166]|tara:strand:- start:5794 stop:6339 length:546 start_codon:yes stop_codon:yes gene_type:complete
MKLTQLLLSVIVLSSSAYTVQAQHVSDPSLIATGAKVYSENCARCHNARPAEEYSKQEWSVVMPHMRAKAHMTGKETLAVEAFLASTLTSDVRNNFDTAGNKAPQRSGEELISAFGCQGCHSLKGQGGTLGPKLDSVVADKGQDFVLRKLKDPKFNNAVSAMPKYPMTEEDMQVIVRYLNQ